MKALIVFFIVFSIQNVFATQFGLGVSMQAKIVKNIDDENYDKTQNLYAPFVTYKFSPRWSLMSEFAFNKDDSRVSSLSIERQTYELMLWTKYNLLPSETWETYVALGSGAYQVSTKTTWNNRTREDSGAIYAQLGGMLGIGYRFLRQLQADTQFRLYYPFPEEEAQYRFALSLSYLF